MMKQNFFVQDFLIMIIIYKQLFIQIQQQQQKSNQQKQYINKLKIQLITKSMNKRNINFDKGQLFPMQQLQKFLQKQNNIKIRHQPKNILSSKFVTKNHSKSLYYCGTANHNLKHINIKKINQTGNNLKDDNYAQQTLNQQLLGIQRKKPATSDYRSGRNHYNNINGKAPVVNKTNKNSLRTSSNYSKFVSVAGIALNQTQAKQRLQSQLHTKQYIRRNKQKQLQKQNQKFAKRLDSQQSIYSTKKILKEYQTQQKISKRLTSSKMSKRSNIQKDNRSSISNSSRASVRSHDSKTQSIRNMKSTYRSNSSSSIRNKKNLNNRFQAKFKNNKKIQIVQHNINRMNQNELTNLKNLFANSFTTTNNSASKQYQTTFGNNKDTFYHQRNYVKNNPYVDVEVLSQKSQTSKKSIKTYGDIYLSNNNSNRKLREINSELNNLSKDDKTSVMKKSSAITSSLAYDGLLHRIAQEMYNKNNTQDFKSNQISIKKKKQSQNSVRKMIGMQKAKQKIHTSQKAQKGRRILTNQIKIPLSTNNNKIFCKI